MEFKLIIESGMGIRPRDQLNDVSSDWLIRLQLGRYNLMRSNPDITKCWWTLELSLFRRSYAKLSRIEYSARDMLMWAEARAKSAAACNKYTSTLRHTKALHWKSWLENITEDDIWKAGWMAQSQISDSSMMHIPTLVDKAPDGTVLRKFTTDFEKQDIFIWSFFP